MFVPTSGRRPIETDEWHVILRRTKLAGRLRHVLYGGSPPHAHDKRMTTWAFLVREFVRLRDFRYVELLRESRRFVTVHGYVESDTFDEELDLDLLKAFQVYLYDRRRELATWLNREEMRRDPQGMLERKAAQEAKSLALLGVCGVCGGDLPCGPCGLPAVALDGKGGLTAVEKS